MELIGLVWEKVFFLMQDTKLLMMVTIYQLILGPILLAP